MRTLPAWRRQFNFGLTEHQRQQDALNGVADLSPTPGMDVVSTFTNKGLLPQPQRRIGGTTYYQVTLFGVTVWGGLYQCQVWDDATAVPIDMAAAGGIIPAATFGTAYRQDSGGPDASVFYCRNNAETYSVSWSLLGATRTVYTAVDRGEKASDGTRVLLLLSEFGVKACSQAMTAADMNAGF